MRKKAILYCRVSTEEQADKGYSLRDQEERLKFYCENNKIDIICIYREDHSAKNFIRPEFRKIFEFLRNPKNKVDLLLFLKWDRFSRNAPEAYDMLKKLSKHGVTAKAIEQPIDLSVPENKFMLALYLTAPEVENDRRSINVMQGMRRAKLEGRWPCTAPMGYSNRRDEINRPIIVPNEKAAFIKKAFQELDRNFYSIEEIRRRLQREGFRCSKSNFHRIIRNPIYIGKIKIEPMGEHPAQIVEGMHTPIISPELFIRVQDLLEGRRKINAHPIRHSVHEKLPLRGILQCSKCGRKLTGSGSKGNGGRFFYYHCTKGCKVRFRAEKANIEVSKLISKIQVQAGIQDIYKDIVNDYFTTNGQSRESLQRSLLKKIELIKTRIRNLENKFADNEITGVNFNQLNGRFLNELRELESQKNEMNIYSKDIANQVNYCIRTISDIGKFYSNADASIKREILGSIFPESIIYSDNKVRTVRMNEVVKLLCPSIGTYEIKSSRRKIK
ncbi:MAG TPA: recombinase family protein [Candidatus Scalindua sp.]|nr:recombinase family protein [Candidatus Scalindua sp.]